MDARIQALRTRLAAFAIVVHLAAFQGCAGLNPFALELMIDLALDGHAHVGGR